MRRFLRDAAVALAVGVVLVALAMLLKSPPDELLNGKPETTGESALP